MKKYLNIIKDKQHSNEKMKERPNKRNSKYTTIIITNI